MISRADYSELECRLATMLGVNPLRVQVWRCSRDSYPGHAFNFEVWNHDCDWSLAETQLVYSAKTPRSEVFDLLLSDLHIVERQLREKLTLAGLSGLGV